MSHDPREQGFEGGHDAGVKVSRVLGVVLQRLVLNILTHPVHRLLAVSMVWGIHRGDIVFFIIIFLCCRRSAYAIDHAPTDAGGACKTSSQRTRARATRDYTIMTGHIILFLLIMQSS